MKKYLPKVDIEIFDTTALLGILVALISRGEYERLVVRVCQFPMRRNGAVL